jgi:hypothetical protein
MPSDTDAWLLSGGAYPADVEGARAPALTAANASPAQMAQVVIERLYFRECPFRRARGPRRYRNPVFRKGAVGSEDADLSVNDPLPKKCGPIPNFYGANARSKATNMCVELYALDRGPLALGWFRAGILHLERNNDLVVDLVIICVDKLRFPAPPAAGSRSLYSITMDFAKAFLSGNAPAQTDSPAAPTLVKYSQAARPYGTAVQQQMWANVKYLTLMAVNAHAASVYVNTGFDYYAFSDEVRTTLFDGTATNYNVQRSVPAASRAVVLPLIEQYLNDLTVRPTAPGASMSEAGWNLSRSLTAYSRANSAALKAVLQRTNREQSMDRAYIMGLAGPGAPTAAQKRVYAYWMVMTACLQFVCDPLFMAEKALRAVNGAPSAQAIRAAGVDLSTRAAALLGGGVTTQAGVEGASTEAMLDFAQFALPIGPGMPMAMLL